MKKICFAASSGGHFEQLMMLRPLMEKYDCFLLMEKTAYEVTTPGIRHYTLPQVNRREKSFPFRMLAVAFRSLVIFLRERPQVVVTTGVLAMIPMALLCKLFGGKLVFIESFAKVNSPTETGKFLYRFSDRFYVQWESMRKFYPDAVNLGSIY